MITEEARMTVVPMLQNKIEHYIREHKLNSFLDLLLRYGDIVIFGGFVRDININNDPKDIDIVIDCPHNVLMKIKKEYSKKYDQSYISRAKEVEKKMWDDEEAKIDGGNADAKLNKFGGLKFHVNGLFFDVWTVDNTWAIKENIIKSDISNIYKTAPFSCNQITYNYKTKEFQYRPDYFKLIKDKRLLLDKEVSIEDYNPVKRECYLLNKLYSKKLRLCYLVINHPRKNRKLDSSRRIQFGDSPPEHGVSPYMVAVRSLTFHHNYISRYDFS